MKMTCGIVAIGIACAVLECVAYVSDFGSFRGDVDDGGRCPRCGKYTLRGSKHLCNPKKKSKKVYVQRGGSSDEKKPEEKKPKNITIPDVLKSLRNTLSEKVISTESRLWTDDKRREIDASWTHITQDKSSIYLKSASTGKTRCIKVSSLCAADKRKVNEYVAAEEAKKKVWHRGIYVDEKEIEEFEKIEEVKAMIREKDEFASRIEKIKVFRSFDNYSLCWPYTDGKEGHKPIKFIPSKKKFLADDETVSGRFFWCGTYRPEKYDPTVHCLTDDPEFSIKYLLAQMDASAEAESGSNSSGSEANSNDYSLRSHGSGFFITEDGYLITNYHVVKGSKKMAAWMDSGKVEAKVIYADPETDLALLKVEGQKVKPFKSGSRRTELLSTPIWTIGFPMIQYEGFDPKVTDGSISGEKDKLWIKQGGIFNFFMVPVSGC